MRPFGFALFFLPAVLSAQHSFTQAEHARWQNLARTVTIRRDHYGVPHIYGKTDAAVVFGLMYAQAEDNFWQLEEGYIDALGRSAELYGDSALASDISVRLFEVERKAKQGYRNATPRMRRLYDAFAAGLNWYIETHPGAPRLLTRFEPWWALVNEFGAPTIDSSTVIDSLRLKDWSRVKALAAGEPDDGSNMWAIAPTRSSSGRAMLFINPHVGFFGGGQRYELHLESMEGWRFSGFAILGTPIPRTGHNAQVGWSHTNNNADASDLYMETLDDSLRPRTYRYGDAWRPLAEWRDSVRVKTDKGVVTRFVTLRKTHHGPIVAWRGTEALALRRARSEDGGSLEQRYLMGMSRSFSEWKRAMARGRIVGSNTMYADRAGNIYYVHGNAIPRRAAGIDPSKPLDGRDTITEWQGYWPPDSLPNLLNPKSGYLVNANSSPFHMTADGENPDSARWPRYVAPEPYNARARSSQRIFAEHRKFSFDELSRAAFDRRAFLADSLVPPLISQWEARGGDGARSDSLSPLVAELHGWDRTSDTSSVAMTLFHYWTRRLRGTGEASPLLDGTGTPSRYLPALEDVRRGLERDFGTWRVRWGDVNRLQRVHTSGRERFSDARPSLPVRGGPPSLGIIFAFNARAERGEKKLYGVSGNTYVSVVEFGPKTRARSLLVFGQSADSASSHFLDQAAMYANGEMKDAWFERREVIANTERAYSPGIDTRASTTDYRLPTTEPFDLLIRGGTLVDGTGTAPRRADVGISGDRIVYVGDAAAGRVAARRTIQAGGLVVAPGFIDPHTHTLEDLSSDDRNRRSNVNYLMQGVTTVITGNDGGGPVEVGRVLGEWERDGIGTNGALLVGHGSARRRVMGMSGEAPTAPQLDSMRAFIAHAMDDGALGMSTGLYYAPGSYASTEEVIALARVVAEKGGVYDSHMRDESSYSIGLINAVREAIRIAREARIPANISHIKALGTDVWGKSDSVVGLIKAARAEGLRITADHYPYIASGSSVSASLLPRWAETGGRDSLLARIADAPTRERLARDMTENLRRRGGASSLLITRTRDTTLRGKTLADVATMRSVPAIDAAIEIIRSGDAGVASFNMKDADLERFLVQDFVSTGSDGSEGHPRKYGAFPRVLREYVYEKRLLTLEQAIERSSARTAAAFGVPDRGRVVKGGYADVIVFDPRTIGDRATYSEPERLATGMQWVVVNGVIAIEEGKYTGAMAGKAIRRVKRTER